MGKFFKNILIFLKPNENYRIGLSSYKIKKQKVANTSKPEIKAKSTLNFSLLH